MQTKEQSEIEFYRARIPALDDDWEYYPDSGFGNVAFRLHLPSRVLTVEEHEDIPGIEVKVSVPLVRGRSWFKYGVRVDPYLCNCYYERLDVDPKQISKDDLLAVVNSFVDKVLREKRQEIVDQWVDL